MKKKLVSLLLSFIVLILPFIVLSPFVPQAEAANGLVAAYSFGEGSGNTTADSSGTGNSGFFVGPVWTAAGKYGSALNFDGINDLVTVNDSPTLDLTSGMTLEAWVRPTAISGWRSIILKERVNNLSYALYGNNNLNRPDGEISINNTSKITNGSAQLPLNTWTHVAVTYNGSSLILFVNGTQVSSKVTTGSIQTSTNQLTIGGNTVWGEYFKGVLDEIRLYNTALTQNQIQTDMNTPIAPPTVTSTPTPTPTLTPSPTISVIPTPTGTLTPTRTPTPTPTPVSDLRAQKGEWTNHMTWPIVAVHASLLPNGKVLAWDGWELQSNTKIWDPSTNSFTTTVVQSGLFCSAHSYLANGTLLIAGGWQANGDGIVDTNSYDYTTQVWSRLPDMTYKRWYPTTIELADGKILALSGMITSTEWADKPEVYDPATNKWTVQNIDTSSMHDLEYPFIYKRPDGKMYVVSPYTGKLFHLDLTAQTWTSAGTSPIQYGALTQYAPGKVLMTGGGQSYSGPSGKSAAVIDLTEANPSWRSVASMYNPRYQHNLLPLPDGTVLAVGGAGTVYLGATDGIKEAELWNPTTESWTRAASMPDSRMYHSTAMLLPDGRVLSAGGGRYGGTQDMLTADIYNPPYLYKGTRPTISSITPSVTYNGTFSINSADTSSIAKVVMVSLPSVTHTVDMNQFFSPLTFMKNGSTLSATAPSNANYAPPGFYMIFIVNGNGVPSVAKIIQLTGSGTAITPTPTTTPTGTPSVTPTTTPSVSPTPSSTPPPTQTVTFDTLTQNQTLSGQYPAGVIDWGSNTWFVSPPWGSFSTKSISFTSGTQTSGSFTFVNPRKLKVLDVFNGGGSTTLTLKCTGQNDKTASVAPGQLLTIPTGWTGTCTTVTVQSTNGWDTNFDNFVIE
jgi:hypothetical protein